MRFRYQASSACHVRPDAAFRLMAEYDSNVRRGISRSRVAKWIWSKLVCEFPVSVVVVFFVLLDCAHGADVNGVADATSAHGLSVGVFGLGRDTGRIGAAWRIGVGRARFPEREQDATRQQAEGDAK